MSELITLLQCYLMSSKSFGECGEWLAGVDWDDPSMTYDEKETVGVFEILATDIAEGLRDERECREAAEDFISRKTTERFSEQAPKDISTSVGTAIALSPIVEVVVPVGQGSQSWNISPLVGLSS